LRGATKETDLKSGEATATAKNGKIGILSGTRPEFHHYFIALLKLIAERLAPES